MTRTSVWFIAVSVLPLLVACGEGENKAATQAVAKVGKEELTVHQLNALLVRTPNPTPEQEQAAARQAVERLIDQELLVQQAEITPLLMRRQAISLHSLLTTQAQQVTT